MAINQKVKSVLIILQNFQIFEKIRKENPKFRHKIVPIGGDCMLPGLGIDPNERALLVKHVDIVYHVAATVRSVSSSLNTFFISFEGTTRKLLGNRLSFLCAERICEISHCMICFELKLD